MYKSTDGGETWTEITRNAGMPAGMVGRIGLANTKADSNRVYALVENENGGLFVSDDAGASWKLINESRAVRQRAFYYTHVFGDPSNKDVVYMQNTSLFRSTDGGKTTVQVGQNTHGDHHDLWVDPDDPNHVVDGNDGGGAITYDINSRVPNWSAQDFPTAQWYHVITTAHLPFHVCGSQQDNSTLCVPSNTNAPGGGFGGIPPVAPYQVGRRRARLHRHARDRSGHLLRRHQQRLVPDPPQPPHRRVQGSRRLPALLLRRAVEGRQGALAVDLPDHLFVRRSERALHELAARVEDHQWRRHLDSDQRRPVASRSKDDAGSGGPITHDMNSPEIYGTVFSLAPGKKDRNLLWAGSDDGAGARHARRGQDLDQRHAARHAGLRPRQPARWLVVRQRHRLHGGEEDAARRSLAVHLQDQRLRQDLDEDRQRHSGERLRAHGARGRRRAAACSTPARSTASTFPSTTASCGRSSTAACLDRAGDRSGRRRQRDRDRHARPQLLRDGRHRGAAPVRPGAAHRRGGVQAGECDARSRSADHHLFPEVAAEAADDRFPRRQGPGGALDHRPAAAQGR